MYPAVTLSDFCEPGPLTEAELVRMLRGPAFLPSQTSSTGIGGTFAAWPSFLCGSWGFELQVLILAQQVLSPTEAFPQS